MVTPRCPMAARTALPRLTLFLLALFGGSLCIAATRPSAPTYQPQVINPDITGGLLVHATRVLLVWGSDGTILRSEDGERWSHAITPGSADLARICANASGSVIVAVGAQGTILRSTDGGKTWAAARNDTKDTDLLAVVNQTGGRIWIAAGTNGRILRSSDDGKIWTLVDSQLKIGFQTLFVDQFSQSILIGGDEGLVGFSKDAGVSWQITAISMPEPVTPVTGFHRFGKLLIATSALGRFLTSEDDARSWDLMQASTKAFFTDCAFDPLRKSIVMTGHNGDVLRSADGGRTWEGSEISIDGQKNYLSAIRFDANSSSLIAVGQGGTVARSIDGGAQWSKASDEMSGDVRGVIDDPVRGRLVVFGPGGMILASKDSGAHWKSLRSLLDVSLREITAAPKGEALIATGRLGAVVRSTDGGATWKVMSVPYPNPNTPPDLRGLAASPSGGALIAVGPPAAILRSNADGSVWDVRHSEAIEAERAFPWLLVDHRRKIAVAVEARGEMRVSHDDGMTWQPSLVETPPGIWPYWQGTVLESAGVMLVAGQAGHAARSPDAHEWQGVATGTDKDLFGSFADETQRLLFLMGAGGTLLRSADLGITWQTVTSGTVNELRRMMRDPRTGTLLCFGNHGTILRSQDHGLTWQVVPSGIDGALRNGMLEARTGNLLLVGSQGAILRSRDGGLGWEALPSHTTRHFNSMWVDERSGDIVLVGERIVRLARRFDGKIGHANEPP
jgi:photosystem II stability/assembly factor-like uncharacterized protein